MNLTKLDKESALWKRLDVFMTQRLDELRRANDGALDERTTAHVRGSIAMLKELLALGEYPTLVVGDATDDAAV